ncbi:MAG: hypothetical protein P4L99_22785, partial [Chthoniobacter sp.]|nr:hypothetical protein [Chthoniobacter sp.]
FFKEAGHFAVHAALGGGALYAGAHAVRGAVENAAERNRAEVRYDQMGLSEAQLGEGRMIADRIAEKYPSISRTETLDDLRKNASRLGSWDRAKEVADSYAAFKVVNKLSGGGEHEGEQVIRALEGAGKANNTADFARGMNMWAKIKAANPDYTGEQFRSDLAAASSAKYAASDEFIDNVFPILASHTSGFGNKMSTGLSALVGGRMKKEALHNLEKAGLIKDGHLIDEQGFIANGYEWTQQHYRSRLEKDLGVHFSERMTEADKGKVIARTQKDFSAKNAADLILTYLFDSPLVEKAAKRQTKDSNAAEDLQSKDGALAWEGVKKQIGDFGTELTNTSAAISVMGQVAHDFASYAEWVRTGKVPESLPGLHRMLGRPDDIWDQHAASMPDDAEASRSMIGTSAASYMKSGPLKTQPDMTMDDALDGTGTAMRRY